MHTARCARLGCARLPAATHLIEELENERNAIGEDQVLTHEFELVNVVDFEMLEKQEKDSGNGLDDNFLVTVDVDP